MTQRIDDIIADQNAQAAATKKERDRIERQISRLQTKLDNLPRFGTVSFVGRLVRALEPHFPMHVLDVLGPFGLTGETAIHVKDSIGITVASLTFRSDEQDDGTKLLRMVDYDNPTNRYPKNSLGAVNGMNYPIVTLPDTVEELVEMIHTQINERLERTS